MIKVKRKNMKLQNISIAIPVGKESTVITYLIIIFVNLWKSRSQLKTSCRCKLQIQLNNLSRVLYKRVANHFTHIPSSIFSWSIGHILEHEFFCLGRLGSSGSKGKKVDLSFSKQLLRVVFSTFDGQNKHSNFFLKLL